MSLRITLLGCGSSAGVPRLVTGWGACDATNPKNRRRRCSLLVERVGPGGTTRVLVDTSPDLREQLLGAGADALDAVLFTHAHADHTHGIDDLRPIAMRHGRLPAYLDEATSEQVRAKFGYIFETPAGSLYPPILSEHRLAPGQRVSIAGPGGLIHADPYLQEHGGITSLGFRFGGLAYSCDLSGIPQESFGALEDLDVWIVDALRYTPHPSHLHVAASLSLIERIRPRRAVLTNLHTDLDYERLRSELPARVEPGYDGLVMETDA